MIHLFIPLFAVLAIFGIIFLVDLARVSTRRLRRPRPDTWRGLSAYYRNRGHR
jgi:hypothetical protein